MTKDDLTGLMVVINALIKDYQSMQSVLTKIKREYQATAMIERMEKDLQPDKEKIEKPIEIKNAKGKQYCSFCTYFSRFHSVPDFGKCLTTNNTPIVCSTSICMNYKINERYAQL